MVLFMSLTLLARGPTSEIVHVPYYENRYAHILGTHVLILGAPILICTISGFHLSIHFKFPYFELI